MSYCGYKINGEYLENCIRMKNGFDSSIKYNNINIKIENLPRPDGEYYKAPADYTTTNQPLKYNSYPLCSVWGNKLDTHFNINNTEAFSFVDIKTTPFPNMKKLGFDKNIYPVDGQKNIYISIESDIRESLTDTTFGHISFSKESGTYTISLGNTIYETKQRYFIISIGGFGGDGYGIASGNWQVWTKSFGGSAGSFLQTAFCLPDDEDFKWYIGYTHNLFYTTNGYEHGIHIDDFVKVPCGKSASNNGVGTSPALPNVIDKTFFEILCSANGGEGNYVGFDNDRYGKKATNSFNNYNITFGDTRDDLKWLFYYDRDSSPTGGRYGGGAPFVSNTFIDSVYDDCLCAGGNGGYEYISSTGNREVVNPKSGGPGFISIDFYPLDDDIETNNNS